MFSSGAENYMEIRGPHDIINLGLLFGLKDRNSGDAVTKNCKSVILHAFARSKTAKSVISIRKVGELLCTLESIVKMSPSDEYELPSVFAEEPLEKDSKKS